MASVFKRRGKANRNGFYYVAWHEYDGGRLRRRTKCTKTTDKATAERIASKYEAEAALRREGVVDAALEAVGKESQRALETHLDNYEAKLEASGCSDQYVSETIKRVRTIAKSANFQTASDITADGVNLYANKLKDMGRSARTIHAYLTAIKGFTKWLTVHHKLPRDPLASVKRPNPDTDRRLERRMMLPEEWPWLVGTLAVGEERYGMSAEERLLLYETAIQTGLRSQELRSLTRGRLYFESDKPYITCKAGSTKNRHDARQYVLRGLADRLRTHVSAKMPRSPVFGMPDGTMMASMFRDDLSEARDAWIGEAKGDPQEYSRRQEHDFLLPENHDGETLDFHALRHTCGAWLARAGNHPKVVQTVMRHSNISLTMDTYGHLFPGQEAEAIQQFSMFMTASPLQLAATGTCDNSPSERSATRSSQDAIPCNPGVSQCNEDDDLTESSKTEVPSISASLCNPVPSSTMLCNAIAPVSQMAGQLII